ncbi:hypothetical protein Trydic_g8851 [Trypoxylus dichotomus]
MFVNRTCEFYGDFKFTVNPTNGVNLSDHDRVHFLTNKTCSGGKLHITAEDIYGIYENGDVELSYLNISDIQTYCVEAYEDPVNLILLFCYEGYEDPPDVHTYKFIGMYGLENNVLVILIHRTCANNLMHVQ